MSEPDISTLARRLAEQNNVEWRALKGSGPSGKVVERDVLDYLARVMAGEEALDPTPEPLPDGMEAWPDQDLRSFQQGLGESASDMSDFRNDLAASVEESLDAGHERPDDGVFRGGGHHLDGHDPAGEDVSFERDVEGVRAAGAAHTAEEALGGNGAPIDEDIFLFDDEDETDTTQVHDGPVAGSSGLEVGLEESAAAAERSHHDTFGDASGWAASDDATDFADAQVDARGPEVGDAARDADGWAASSLENAEAFDAEAVDIAGEPDDLLVVDGDGDDDQDAFPLSAGDGVGDDDGAGWQAPAEGAATPEGESAWAGDDIRIGRDAFGLEERGDGAADDDLWVDGAPPEGEAASTDDGDRVWTGPSDTTDDVDLWDERDGAATDSGAESGVGFESPTTDASTAEGAMSAGADRQSYGDLADYATDEGATHLAAEATERPGMPEDSIDPSSGSEAGTFATTEAVYVPGGYDDAAAGGAAALGAAASATRALPLARTTTLLRRHIDVSALAAAQLAVGQELGEEEPLGASAFLLRAVAKAARDVDFDGGQVALAVIGDGVRLRRVDDAASRSFGSLVAELRDAGVEEDEIGLIAADLSGLDLDEAVLDVAAPVVTLGRILYDNQRGAYRSTLSLAGDLPLDLGARLLARVADLLDAPVRLVL